MTKNGQKWPQNKIFGLFEKSSISFVWNWCKTKVVMVPKDSILIRSNINDFCQKKLFHGKSVILGPKIAHLHNSELALRIFFF